MSGTTVQQVIYVSVNVQDILYGVELVLYFQTMQALLSRKKWRRSDVLHMLLSNAMLILITIWVSTNAVFGEEICVIYGGCGDNTNGPSNTTAVWYMSLGRAAVFVLQLITDALLIYRCWAIWSSARVIVVPFILWVAALAVGVAQSWMIDTVNTFLPTVASLVVLTYLLICVILNATLSALICYRVIRHGKRIRAQLGQEYSSVHFAVAEIIVESALPFTLSGIAFVASLGSRSYAVVPCSWLYYMMACISPQMLILRVTRRQALGQQPTESSKSKLRLPHVYEVPVRGGAELEGELQLRPLSKVCLTGPGGTCSDGAANGRMANCS